MRTGGPRPPHPQQVGAQPAASRGSPGRCRIKVKAGLGRHSAPAAHAALLEQLRGVR